MDRPLLPRPPPPFPGRRPVFPNPKDPFHRHRDNSRIGNDDNDDSGGATVFFDGDVLNITLPFDDVALGTGHNGSSDVPPVDSDEIGDLVEGVLAESFPGAAADTGLPPPRVKVVVGQVKKHKII